MVGNYCKPPYAIYSSNLISTHQHFHMYPVKAARAKKIYIYIYIYIPCIGWHNSITASQEIKATQMKGNVAKPIQECHPPK